MHFVSRLSQQKKFFLRYVSSNSANNQVVFENLLSDESKQRCKQNILKHTKDNSNSHLGYLPNKAAVFVPLCEVNGIPSMLFTRRAHGLKKSGSEVCFPGGRVDDNDKNIIHTALRETEEEIGLAPSNVDVWTTLPAVPDYNITTEVHGVIGSVGKIDLEELTINPEEVAHVFTVPIAVLGDPNFFGFTHFRFKNKKRSEWDYTTPVYLTEPPIWGLTACYVNVTLSALLPNHEVVGSIWRQRFNEVMGHTSKK